MKISDNKVRASKLSLGLIVSLFFLWGMANNLNDVLISHFRHALALGDFQSGLVQSAFYMGYFCFAIPAALFMRRHGYKGGVVLGLALFGLGALLFWPAATAVSYPGFLVALFVIASGLAFLETAANPLVAVLGPPESAARRLNLAQAFNPLGSIAGIELGRRFILSDAPSAVAPYDAVARASETAAVQLPYALIGGFVLIWALLIAGTRFPTAAMRGGAAELAVGSFDQYKALVAKPRFLAGVAAQFFYVGAQVGIWSYLIRYAQVAMPGIGAATAAGYISASLVIFAIGRFVGSALMLRFRPAPILLAFALIDAVLCVCAALVGGTIGVFALVGASLFMSIMYPTIFVLAIGDLGPLAKPAASLMVMAIIGGAAMTLAMGLVSDATHSIALAMLLPGASFLAIVGFARLHLTEGLER